MIAFNKKSEYHGQSVCGYTISKQFVMGNEIFTAWAPKGEALLYSTKDACIAACIEHKRARG